MDGQTDKLTDRRTYGFKTVILTDILTDGQTNRQTDWRMDGQTDGQPVRRPTAWPAGQTEHLLESDIIYKQKQVLPKINCSHLDLCLVTFLLCLSPASQRLLGLS